MTREPDIWNRLQEYEILPPPGTFVEVCARVNLAKLVNFEILPPAALRSSVEKLIFNAVVPPPRLAKKGLSFYGIRAVAACLLLAFAGWLVYRTTISQKVSVATLNKKNTTGFASGKNVAAQQPDSLSQKDSLAKKDSLSGTNALADDLSDKDSIVPAKAGKYKTFLSFSLNGQRLPLTDNDLLITFASLKYNEIPDFINRSDEGSWKIHIDQYTNIYISQPMSEMMKEMSLFKSNGSPTRKARKSREKLDKWKKSDEIQFDQSLKKNPLDPLDLGEFIFK
ncbi:MAG TPA: hypothetical protein VNS58_15230 [Puia sp.]|nr:hypothetical protein [Puia sp.]